MVAYERPLNCLQRKIVHDAVPVNIVPFPDILVKM